MKEGENTEIRSVHIDFDKNILEINGKQYKKETIVTLPGADGWDIQKMFNANTAIPKEKCDCLKLTFMPTVNNKP